jgi:ankyrin repeat protein
MLRNAELLFAVKKGELRLVEYWLDERQVPPTVKDEDGRTPLHWAAMKGFIQIARLLLEYGAELESQANDESTPLLDAVACGKVEMVQFLLEKGADIWITDECDLNVLHWAISEGNLITAILLLNRQLALANKAKFNGFAPAHMLAGQANSVELAQMLLSFSTNLDKADDYGDTPLHRSAETGDLALARFLVKHHSRIFKTNSQNLTPIETAYYNGHMQVGNYFEKKVIQRQIRSEI